MKDTLSNLIMKSDYIKKDSKHDVVNSDIFKTVVFRNSDLNDSILISIQFQNDVVNELLRYRAIHEVEKIKFFDFFGFDDEFKYLFTEIKIGTTLSKKRIADIIRRGDIQNFFGEYRFQFYLLTENIDSKK